MPLSTIIIGGLIVCGVIAISALLRKKRPVAIPTHNSPDRSNRKRSADARVLTSQQLQFFRKAKGMAKEGHFRQASQLLEQIGLHREAIALLEEAGLIDDAAIILMKMRLPNRAGAVYARHKRWKEAADCFRQAGMAIEAAKCLWECQSYADAAKLFLDGGREKEAAVCLVAAKNWHAAAKLFLKVGRKEKAVQAYEAVFAENNQVASIVFEVHELDLIQEVVLNGQTPVGFVEVLSCNGRMIQVIRKFIERGEQGIALQLYQSSVGELGPLLMSEINLQSNEANILANIFREANQMRYAGMVYEQKGDYGAAAQCFEDSQEFERASYCWERAGDRNRAKLATAKVNTNRKENSGFSNIDGSSETQVVDTTGSKVVPGSNRSFVPARGAGVFAIESTANRTGAGTKAGTRGNNEDRKIFDTCVLFKDVIESQLDQLWQLKRLEFLDPGSELYRRPGEPSGLYVILEGTIECYNEESPDIAVDLQQGEFFGENWTLANKSEQAFFKAKTNVRLLLLEQANFVQFLDANGRTAYTVYKNFTEYSDQKKLKLLKPKLNLVAS